MSMSFNKISVTNFFSTGVIDQTPLSISNNTSMEALENSFTYIPSHKLKLDAILQGIKSLQIDNSTSKELRSAIKLLRKFKLFESAKFCSEWLQSLNDPSQSSPEQLPQGKNWSSIFNKVSPSCSAKYPSDFNTWLIEDKYWTWLQKYKNDEHNIKDIVTYASSWFDWREYNKCIFVWTNYVNSAYPKAMYLYYLCKYTLVQQALQEDKLNKTDYSDIKYVPSIELNKLEEEVSRHASNFSPFMCYWYGVILKDLKRFTEAKKYFLRCLNDCPLLWSCWVELCKCWKYEDFKYIFSEIDDHWVKYFYLLNFLLEKNYEEESVTLSKALINYFPNSIYILNSLAVANYLLFKYDCALDYFDKLLQIDPNRYENLETYSHILFLKENYCELCNLAYKCYQNDKYRPETCCVIGNYYALKVEHLNAVRAFKRAVKLDNNFIAGWTLLGHEYLEMKLIPLAIESYRSAIEIDPGNHHSWYGLGRTYELHQIYNFALFYFLNAAKAAPNDSRMWTSAGVCYERIDKKIEAIKCYEKAVFCKDRERIALFKMAKLYCLLTDFDKAAICFKENLEQYGDDEFEISQWIESCLFLGNYYKEKRQYDDAWMIMVKLKDYDGKEKEEIRSLLKEIRNLKKHERGKTYNI